MKELYAALAKAQSQIDGAKKDSTNPHFRSKYADLASVWDACREALTSNGLAVVQFGAVSEAGAVLVTRLTHSSGEAIEGSIPLLNGKGDMQGLGSALTYARRYGLAAMVGVCPEDDDGNAASAKPPAEMVTKPMASSPTDGLLRIVETSRKETSKPGIFRTTVVFSDGQQAATIKDQLGDLCRELSETGVPCTAVIEQGKWGPNLMAVSRVVEAEPEPQTPADAPVIDASSIPFAWIAPMVLPLVGLLC